MAGIALTDRLRAEYEQLFDTCRVTAERQPEVDALVRRVGDHRARYEAIETALAVPWYVVAMLHCMEASLRFDRHLHNGDPLTGRTVRVPAGRPPTGTPPFTWEESAVDALTYDKVDRWTDWSLAGTLYELEGYNGWGYRQRHPEVLSPYLWSFSNHYTRGKYIADGTWSSTAVSKQSGCAVLLRRMAELDAVRFGPALGGGPLIRYWTQGPAVPGAVELQLFLNRMPGIFVKVDGKAGARTSEALRKVVGHYLVGDPRENEVASRSRARARRKRSRPERTRSVP